MVVNVLLRLLGKILQVLLCDQTQSGQNRFWIDRIDNPTVVPLKYEQPKIDLEPSLLVRHSNYVDPAFCVGFSPSCNQIPLAPETEKQVGTTYTCQSCFSIHTMQDEFHATFLMTACALCYLKTFSNRKVQSKKWPWVGWWSFCPSWGVV